MNWTRQTTSAERTCRLIDEAIRSMNGARFTREEYAGILQSINDLRLMAQVRTEQNPKTEGK